MNWTSELARETIRVLGVDTSLRSSGVAVVEQHNNNLSALKYGNIPNPAKRRHSECLNHIYQHITGLIAETNPHVVAVEGIFFFKNAKTAVVLGQARGVVLAAAAAAGLPCYEYAPRRIKQAIVGNGAAHKEQISKMVMSMLNLTTQPQSDAGDALAIAICHLHSSTGIAATQLKQI